MTTSPAKEEYPTYRLYPPNKDRPGRYLLVMWYQGREQKRLIDKLAVERFRGGPERLCQVYREMFIEEVEEWNKEMEDLG